MVQGDMDDVRVISNGIQTRIMELENLLEKFPEEYRVRLQTEARIMRSTIREVEVIMKEIKRATLQKELERLMDVDTNP